MPKDCFGRYYATVHLKELSSEDNMPSGIISWFFYCPSYKLAIEADGGQHFEEANGKRDDIRTKELSGLGIRVIRFSNTDILKNVEGVYEAIQRALKNTPHPSTSPQRGEEVKKSHDTKA